MVLTVYLHEQHDHWIPPAKHIKHLYRFVEEPYDLTGEDCYGQSTLHVCRTANNPTIRITQREEYPMVCTSYLESTGVDLDFLENSNDMSLDPMEDLINEAFYHPTTSLRFPKRGYAGLHLGH